MGLLKKLFKGVKKIFKGIGKEFKKFAKSSIGKAILIGAAIFIGGGMLGLWGSPTWLGGAGMGGAQATAAATEATTVGTLGGTTAGTVAPGAAVIPEVAAAAPGAVETGGLISQTGGFASGGELAAQAAAENAAAGGFASGGNLAAAVEGGAGGFGTFTPSFSLPSAAANTSLLGKVGAGVKGVGSWIGANPIPTLLAGNMIQGAMAPDPYEEWLKQEQYRRANANYAGVYGDNREGPAIVMPTAGLISQAGAGRYNPMGQG